MNHHIACADRDVTCIVELFLDLVDGTFVFLREVGVIPEIEARALAKLREILRERGISADNILEG